MIICAVCYLQLVEAFKIFNLGHIYQHFSEHYAHHLKTTKERMMGKEEKGHRFFFLYGKEVEGIEGKTSKVSNENRLFQGFLSFLFYFIIKLTEVKVEK